MSHIPRIACFHGGGSTSVIFATQCEALQNQLSCEFKFVFFDAPFERDAGPGVLPFFKYEKYGPYRTWFAKTEEGVEIPNGRREEGNGEGGMDRVWRLIEEEGEGGEWVGCMGFSQGTRVVGGLLLDQQRRREMGFPRTDIVFKFGVLCMGAAAPMFSDISDSFTGSKNELIRSPTLHLHGLKDHVYEKSKKQLADFYDKSKAVVWEIDYHHAMPWYKADVEKLVRLIRELYAGILEEAL